MTSQESESGTPFPMFYSSPRPLDCVRDAELKLKRQRPFHFASKTNAVPILIDEFSLAAAHYPIVFAGAEIPVPVAVVGLRTDENLFVSPDNGAWVKKAYIPAYIRRYPFILMDDPKNKQFLLCIDEECGLFEEDGEYPLVKEGGPSDFTNSAMEFCAALIKQGEETNDFAKEMKKYELLIAIDKDIVISEGTHFELKDVNIIDPKKFENLPDDVILEWHKKGWLELVYAQLLSSYRWEDLVSLYKAREEGYLFLYHEQAVKNSDLYLFSRKNICKK